MPGHDNPALWGMVKRHLFRMTIFAYDGSVLTPRSGAPHSDTFQVTTEPNPTTPWKPYMLNPVGWRGRLDLMTAHSEQGEVTVPLVDARLSTNNLQRWVSAFAGDDNNYSALKHAKALIEESFDGGQNWQDHFTGVVYLQIIDDPKTAGPRYELVIKDPRISEYRKIFVGIPHRSITYAMPAPVFPIGVPQMKNRSSNNGWNGLEGAPPVKMYARSSPTGGFFMQISWLIHYVYHEQRTGRFLLTNEFASLADRVEQSTARAQAAGAKICENLRILLRPEGAQTAFKHAYVSPQANVLSGGFGYDGVSDRSAIWIDTRGYVVGIGAVPLPVAHPDYIEIDPGVTYEGYVVNAGPPRQSSPLLIDHVNNVQLWKDIQAGYFGHLDDNGDRVADPIEIDEAAATALQTAFTSVDLRFLISEPQDQQQFCESQIFLPSAFAVRTTRAGLAQLVYTRLREIGSGTVITPETLPSQALVSIRKTHGQKVLGAVSVKSRTYGFTDELELELKEEVAKRKDTREGGFIDAPGGGVYSKESTITYLGARANQIGEAPHTLDILGIEPPKLGWGYDFSEVSSIFEVKTVQTSSHQIFEEIAQNLLEWFEDGAGEVTLVARRIPEVEALDQGDFIVIDADEIPNASSNVRGGPRLYIVLEREETSERATFTLLDAGPNQSPVAPTIGAISVVGTPAVNPSVLVTLNASGQTAQLEYNLTDPSVIVLPTTGWRLAATLTATRTVVLEDPLDGYKVWFRASTKRTASNALPSGFVYPSNNGVTIAAVPRVTSVFTTKAGETVTIHGVPNSVALGMRLSYDVHENNEEPNLAFSIDFDASTFPFIVPVDVRKNQILSFRLTPYSGWNGSAVTGTAGVPVTGTHVAEDAGPAPITTHSWVTQGEGRILRLTVDPGNSVIRYRLGLSGPWSVANGPSVDIPIDLTGGDQVIEFYSTSADGFVEDVNRVQLDRDPDPEFSELALVETSANRLQAQLLNMDDDCKYWYVWAKLNAYPYLQGSNGQPTGEPDPRFLRDEGPVTRSPRPWHAVNGVWYVIARAYDERGHYMERTGTITIVGSSSASGTLSSLAVSLTGSSHRITWAHNGSVDGDYRVVIRETVSGVVRDVLTLGSARPPTWEAGSTSDTIASAGGYDVPVQLGSSYKKFDYEVSLYDGDTFIAQYNVSIEGSNYASSGSGSPTTAPTNLQLSNYASTAVQSSWNNSGVHSLVELEYEYFEFSQWHTFTIIQTFSTPATHQTGGMTPGLPARFWARYVNASGPGPWSNPSNQVVVT